MNTKTNDLHSEMVKRNFELGKEIKRFESENEVLRLKRLIWNIDKNENIELKKLLKQAKPWVDSIDDLPGEEAWAAYDKWKVKYNELMGEESK